jgi:hypothetical protein
MNSSLCLPNVRARTFGFVGLCLSLICASTHAQRIDTISADVLDRRYLFGDKLLVASWNCYYKNDGVVISFYDRRSYRELKQVKVADCDSEYQDNVENLYKSGNNYLAHMEFRYEDAKRPVLIVIDGKTLSIKRRLNESAANSSGLPVESTENHVFDATLGATHLVSGWNSNQYTAERSDAPGYKPAKVTLDSDGPINSMLLVSESQAVFVTHSRDELNQSYYLTDLDTNRSQLIFRGPLYERLDGNRIGQVGFYSNAVIVERVLVFGLGRDLHYIDLSTGHASVVTDYQAGGFKDNGFGKDRNAIDHLLVDDALQRLLVFCFQGDCNSYVPFAAIKAGSVHTPQSPTK